MQTSLPALLAILGMALVTYLTRIGGLWLMRRIPLSQRMQTWLNYLPGSVLVAIVAPTVLTTGLPEAGAALATVIVAARTRNLLLAILAGLLVVLLLRRLLA